MKRRIALGLGAVMAMSAAPAALMAQGVCPAGGQISNTSAGVCVTVDVKENVSVWTSPPTVTLEMDGFDGNNSAVAPATLSYIGNASAEISVDVEGTFPDPVPGSGPADGIRFYIFWNTNDTAAVRSAINNISAPTAPGSPFTSAGLSGLVWNGANTDGGGLLQNVPISLTATNVPITYASASPGELSEVGTFDLAVTYTIAPD